MTSKGKGDSLIGTDAEAMDLPPNFCKMSVTKSGWMMDLNPTKVWSVKEIKTFVFRDSEQKLRDVKMRRGADRKLLHSLMRRHEGNRRIAIHLRS
jgi:hypothetical protein